VKKIVPLIMAVLAAGTAVLPAQLVFEKTLIELHLSPDAEKASADFSFKVAGDREVEIAEYEAPCSCLEAKISDNGKLRWKPGETGTVKGLFSMGNFTGTVDKMVVLRMKGEVTPSVKLTVRLHIPELLKITPAKSLFWEQGGTVAPQTFKIKVANDEPVKIVDVSGTNEQFGIELKTVKDGWEYEIVVTPKTLDERAFGLIRIRTDSKYVKHQRYQCFTVIRRPVAPRPKDLPGPGSPARPVTPPGRVPGAIK
jgi:hypothetical protein